jgi:hypothetical protein
MLIGKTHKLRLLAAAGFATAALVVAPGVANADITSDYHPSPSVRGFDAGASGWASSTEVQGLCIPFLTCPIINNSASNSGGNPGGFVRSGISALLGVGAVSRGVWTSPPFVYQGAGGLKPDDLTFTLSRRADVAAFLGVAGNEATYTVRLVNVGNPGTVTLIDDRPLAGAIDWTGVPAVDVNPNQLTIGQSYAFRIVSQFVNGALVIPGGSADYDNVRLRAHKGGVAGNISNSSLTQFIAFGGGVGGRTFLSGNGRTLFVKTRCPKRAGTTCRNRLFAAFSRRGPRVTLIRTVRVRSGARKFVALRIRPAFRARVRQSNRLTVCAKITVRGKSARACKRVKVVHP